MEALLSQLDAHQAHEALERPLDDRRLRMAQDDEALAFVAAAGGLPLARQAHLRDEMAHLLLCLVETMDPNDAAAPLPAQECDAARVLPLGRIERVEHHELRP